MEKPSFFEELKRRRVIRVATLYVVVFWPLIQVVDILSPALGLPDSAMRFLVFAFVAGLPIALIFAWIFDLNQGGLVRDTGSSEDETGTALIGSKVELGIIGVMLLVVAGLFYVQTSTVKDIEAVSPPVATGVTEPAVGHDTIAVLPFDTFSDETRDRFFADGLTEELLNVLSRVNGLQVAARTSSFAYRGSKKTVSEIGEELGVGVILEGSVRRSDLNNKIRVTAQLIDTSTGSHFWSNTYDREFTDVFKIQDEIAAAVVKELKVTLLGGEEEEIKSHDGASPEAMIANSMGQAELVKRTRVAMEDAVRFFERALAEDENYTDAWVGLADARSLQASYGYGDKDRNIQEAERAVARALELDPNSGRAWASQGLLYRQQGNFDEAREALQKAISLNPSYAMAHMWYATSVDDNEVAFRHFEKAFKLDPRSPVAGYNLAQQYIVRGREGEAMQVFSQIVEADPYYPRAYDLAARISRTRGRLGEAISNYEKAYELQPELDTAIHIAELMVTIGNNAEADEWIAQARELASPMDEPRFDLLDLERYARLGDRENFDRVVEKLSKPFAEYEIAYLVAVQAAHIAGNSELAIERWERAKELADNPDDPFDFGPELLIDSKFNAAYAYLETGQAEEASRLLSEVDAWLESRRSEGMEGSDYWVRTATMAAMRGQDQLALINIQRAINEGWTDHWIIDIEPAFADLRAEQRLQTMRAGLETRLGMIREEMAFEKSFASAPSESSPGS